MTTLFELRFILTQHQTIDHETIEEFNSYIKYAKNL